MLNFLRWLLPTLLILASHAHAGDLAPQKIAIGDLMVRQIDKGGEFLGFGFDALWVASAGRLTRVDAATTAITDLVLEHSGGPCRNIGIGEGAVWVPDCGSGTVYKVDQAGNSMVLKIAADMFSREGSIGVGEGAVWVVTADAGERTLTRFDAVTGASLAEIRLPGSSSGVVVAYGSVWVTATAKGELYRIDPATNKVRSVIKLGGNPKFLVSEQGSIWVFNEAFGTVQRVDGATGQITATIEAGGPGTGDISAGGGSIWVSSAGLGLGQIDPAQNRVIRAYEFERLYSKCFGMRFGAGALWFIASRLYRVQLPS